MAILVGLPVGGGLALAAYKTWLKHRSRHIPIADIEQLKVRVSQLEAENRNLRRRIENMETIIVSEVWEERSREQVPSHRRLEPPLTMD